jgi:hypothetical protein
MEIKFNLLLKMLSGCAPAEYMKFDNSTLCLNTKFYGKDLISNVGYDAFDLMRFGIQLAGKGLYHMSYTPNEWS